MPSSAGNASRSSRQLSAARDDKVVGPDKACSDIKLFLLAFVPVSSKGVITISVYSYLTNFTSVQICCSFAVLHLCSRQQQLRR